MSLPFINEFKTERRMIAFIYVKDFFIIMSFLIFGFLTKGSVHSKLEMLFVIYNILIGLYLTRKSKLNPKKRKYESMYILFIKKNNLYKPVVTTNKLLCNKKQGGEKYV